MAAAARTWNVVILSDDEDLETTFRKTAETTLAEVMQTWRDKCRVFGNWVFASPDGETEYGNDKTLKDIGEPLQIPAVITLKIIPSAASKQNRVIEIFVFVGKKCHQMTVKPNYQLSKVLRRFGAGIRSFEYQGEALNLQQTVQEAGLKHKSLVYESTIRICVKLSKGVRRSFRVPAGALVKHLQAEVATYENGDFSLTYCGRELQPNEMVKGLERPVAVSTVNFAVDIEGNRIVWKTGSGKLKFRDFVAQLNVRSNIDRERLENTVFECSGCGRRISKSEEKYQLIETDCCRTRSLTLTAKLPVENKVMRTRLNHTERKNMKKRVTNQPQAKYQAIQEPVVEGQAIQEPVVASVKLFVWYSLSEFKLDISKSGFEAEGNDAWTLPFLKCHVDVLLPDDCWLELGLLRTVLQPFFIPADPSKRIETVYQWRGEANGKEVAEVTNMENEEEQDVFCDIEGKEFPEEQVEREVHDIKEGKVLIIPGRRTVLQIFIN